MRLPNALNPRLAAERWWGSLRATPGSSLAERTAALTAAAAIGQTFSRGLQPRSPADQAIASAVTAALTYDLTVTAQTAVESIAWRVAGRKPTNEWEASTVYAAGSAGALLAGLAAQVIADRGEDTVTKATVRSVGWKVAAGGAMGVASVSGLELLRRVPGVRHVAEYPFALEVPAGVAASLVRMEVQRVRRAEYEGTKPNLRIVVSHAGRAGVQGLAIGGGVLALLAAEGAVARVVSRGVRKVAPIEGLGPLIGHSVALGMLGATAAGALRWQSQSIEQRNSSVESAYAKPSESDFASTGPRSAVSFDDIGKEGRRFAFMRLPASDIEAVVREPASEPVRIVVGTKSADTAEARVALAIEELERLDAFSRSVICVGVPTGVGYVSYTFTEALEYLTRGDCASVLVQYALRPSALALNAVTAGAAQNRLLVQRLSERLAAMPESKRPRLLLFGESLGAMVALNSAEPEGVDFFKYNDVESALFFGSPYWSDLVVGRAYRPGPVDAFGRMIIAPGMDELSAAQGSSRGSVRYLALSHFDDPIPKFSLRLAVQAPTWMGIPATRPPGVPRETRWRPINTFILTLVDVKNGMDFRPGIFKPKGHDYRYDSARAVAWAFALDASAEQLTRVERALRLREQEWAQRRLVARQLSKARGALRGRLESWGRVPDPVMSKLRPMLEEIVETATRPVADLIDAPIPTPGSDPES